tara:strand:- start:1113 stop:2657 length:1545 start_codon:yes stop_codon:yes gene_type:complete
MFKRILIANRGEIALRVQRTCRELGIETVAVYSDPDRNARHVREADLAVNIGPGPALESYLSIDKIIDAAKQTGAEAIHPGYGFLSENALFTEACDAADIVFIGPSGSAMRAMGDKVSARLLMEKAGVPVIPGANDIDAEDVDTAMREAERIGYPLMVKAASGGGGRGIRLVHQAKDLESGMRQAGREAQASFGDSTIFLEKYVSPARHIEVQVMADNHGNVRTFGERECSIQRRNQKVLEEAPSIAVTPEIRSRLCEAAVSAAKSCDYRNAGTVEFLMDADGSFYFLEMNARLQVEHPVTELVYGVDLVALQLAVAVGEPLPEHSGLAEPHGWAIEARINGENSYRNFMPDLGLIEHVEFPTGPGVRFDTMLFDGLELPVFYDSLVGKLIVWAEDRELAVRRLRRALHDLIVVGIETNAPFHLALLDHPDFQTGNFHTGWLEASFEMPPLNVTTGESTALVAAAIAATVIESNSSNKSSTSPTTKWLKASRKKAVGLDITSGGSGWHSGIASR